MPQAEVVIDLLLSAPVLRTAFGAGFLGLQLALWSSGGRGRAPSGRTWSKASIVCVVDAAVPALVLVLFSRTWLSLVNEKVPEPYLDEFFHIPQAERYCEAQYLIWDDKITTPPGLYVLSIVWNRILGYECSPKTLRRFNVDAIALAALIALACRGVIEKPQHQAWQRKSAFAIVTAVNTALFPPLFFFSGLYYTDVLSTCVVLGAYFGQLQRLNRGVNGSSILSDIYTILLGVLALFMRQTNIFWVVIYMGALEAVQTVKDLKPDPAETSQISTLVEHIKFHTWRYSLGAIHDPSLSDSWPADLALCAFSIGVAVVCNLDAVLRRVYPHLIILLLFIAFVAWNGGVVLGDKNNHVATIHLAQMLYIWPLFAFFSAPLLIPQLLRAPFAIFEFLAQLPGSIKSRPKETIEAKPPSISSTTTKLTKHRRPGPQLSSAVSVPPKQSWDLEVFNYLVSLSHVHTVALVGICVLATLLIIHLNTIIHPFTLADNRHYMFYVFRYSIRRESIRYLLVPVYVFGGWLCWSALYGAKGNERDAAACPSTSTVLIFLLSTSLSLVTAPLVEPRYFILPWVFWRLMIPTMGTRRLRDSRSPDSRLQLILPSYKVRLVLETLWFLAINAVTMYIFLKKPFYWEHDKDGVRAQSVERFMW